MQLTVAECSSEGSAFQMVSMLWKNPILHLQHCQYITNKTISSMKSMQVSLSVGVDTSNKISAHNYAMASRFVEELDFYKTAFC